VGAGERRPQGRCSTKKGESDRSEGDGSERKKTKGMGSTPPRLTLFIEGSTQSSIAAPCSVQHAPTALSRAVSEKIKADFSPTDQALRPKPEFRSSAKYEDNIRSS
jgi:hypothetical protein